jgi:twitching motility protein PilT
MPEFKLDNIDSLLEYAYERKATDLHINVGTKPHIRLNSALHTIEEAEFVTPAISLAIVEQLLDESHLKTLKENGDTDFSFSRSGLGRFRVNVYRQRGTYSIALRSLPFQIPAFESLGLPDSIRSFAAGTKGLILATGPTGSGKSTTLASLIDIINKERRVHIITIEDPIEYLYRHQQALIDQREIGTDARSFAFALRAALREDPDVILVGEMRDPETISIALTAAETGHLVFSTLHTVGAAKTVDRIIDSFPSSQQSQIRNQLASVLEGVVSQQLLPRTDGKGIIPAAEVMLMNAAIRNLIREGKPHQITNILQTSAGAGMQTMDAALAQLYINDVVSYEEASIRAQDTATFQHLSSRKKI